MSRDLVLAKSTAKSLERLPPKLKERVLGVLSSVQEGVELGKPLKARLAGKRSVRVGRSYRIVFEPRAEDIVVQYIGHRRDAYR